MKCSQPLVQYWGDFKQFASCGCGWKGPYRSDFDLVLDDLEEHSPGSRKIYMSRGYRLAITSREAERIREEAMP